MRASSSTSEQVDLDCNVFNHIGACIGAFYKGLIDSGVNEDYANHLTLCLQQDLVWMMQRHLEITAAI